MYREKVKISLPDEEYIDLLGTSIAVFSSNNGFVIENTLHTDSKLDWFKLIDLESGRLRSIISKTITVKSGSDEIENLFMEIVEMRNRIVHGFRITSEENEQVMATKLPEPKGGGQFVITKDYLRDFIQKNEKMSDLLYDYRG